MRQITLRGISPELEKAVKKEAEKKGLSFNKAFLALIQKAIGTDGKEKKKALNHDLDRFFGIWTKEESSTFEESLEYQRRIDGDLWKKQG
ncbi:MAG: hypothetical protein ACYDBV_03010 [Nitrospiria bacterium]